MRVAAPVPVADSACCKISSPKWSVISKALTTESCPLFTVHEPLSRQHLVPVSSLRMTLPSASRRLARLRILLLSLRHLAGAYRTENLHVFLQHLDGPRAHGFEDLGAQGRPWRRAGRAPVAACPRRRQSRGWWPEHSHQIFKGKHQVANGESNSGWPSSMVSSIFFDSSALSRFSADRPPP